MSYTYNSRNTSNVRIHRHASLAAAWLLALIIYLCLYSPQAQADGKVKALLGFGQVVYPNSEIDHANIFGYGFVLDFKPKNRPGSFALDYYRQAGGKDINNIEDIPVTRSTFTDLLMIGGRWNAKKHGFYLGGGVIIGYQDEKFRDEIGNNLDSGFTLAFGYGATLGYDHKLSNGLILGTHMFVADIGTLTFFGSTSETIVTPRGRARILGRNGGNLAQQISFGIGYGW